MKKTAKQALARAFRRVALITALAAFAAALAASAAAETITPCDSLEEINRICATSLIRPRGADVSRETYSVIDRGDCDIAQYCFTMMGSEWVFRSAASALEDISGVYIGAESAFSSGAEEGLSCVFTGEVKIARWFNSQGQFTLSVTDGGVMEEEAFRVFAQELADGTDPDMTDREKAAYYRSLCGEYFDVASGRAMAEAVYEGGELRVTVYWADSAFACKVWEMTVRAEDGGVLYYGDMRCTLEEIGEDGDTVRTVLSENGEGWFTEYEGALYWDGAAEENCAECVFVRDDE